MRSPKGRLELTVMGKDMALIPTAHGKYDYEWVDPADPRACEIKRIEVVDTVGEQAGPNGAEENLLIIGDSGDALRSLSTVPEWAAKYRGKVKLVYIDPPFNTEQTFEHYADQLEHSIWLTMMRDRIRELRPLLSADGSNRLPADAEKVSHYSNPDRDPLGPWFDGNPLNSPNPRENLRFTVTSPTGHPIPPPPNGWRWSRETLQAKIDSGEIRFTTDGKGLRRRTYLRDHAGLPPSTLWTSLEATGHTRQAKSELKALFPGVPTAELFATPKPEKLMQQLIELTTNEGDLVLDCFGGSGTTAAVAHKMNRRWLTPILHGSEMTRGT